MVPLYLSASHSAITPVFCLSHLISFCHFFAVGSFFHHPPSPYFYPRCSCAFIGALYSTRHVSLPHFYPSSRRSLNPLSFAPFCPSPLPVFSLLEPSLRTVPFPLALSVSLILPDPFPLGYLFHSSPFFYLRHRTSPSLFTLWLCHLHLTFFQFIFPLTSLWGFLLNPFVKIFHHNRWNCDGTLYFPFFFAAVSTYI